MTVQLKQIAGGGPAPTVQWQLASVTALDGDQAVPAAIASTPQGVVAVSVNGVGYEVGNAITAKPCYFSGDGGITPRAYGAVVAGDTLHWTGSVAGFQLAATDWVAMAYNA